jgi:hypothetical protein
MEEKYWINWDVIDKVKIGESMGYWELANNIESVSHRLESVKSIIELVAEGIKDNVYSSSLWGSADILGVYIKQLEELSQQTLDLYRVEKEDVAEKATPVAKKATKGKKK